LTLEVSLDDMTINSKAAPNCTAQVVSLTPSRGQLTRGNLHYGNLVECSLLNKKFTFEYKRDAANGSSVALRPLAALGDDVHEPY
jgi:hypothetical protein